MRISIFTRRFETIKAAEVVNFGSRFQNNSIQNHGRCAFARQYDDGDSFSQTSVGLWHKGLPQTLASRRKT